MWLPRPFYEFVPYLYMAAGAGLLAAAWVVETEALPGWLLILGAVCLTAGLVLWLRRRDYRTRQAEYDSHSLDE